MVPPTERSTVAGVPAGAPIAAVYGLAAGGPFAAGRTDPLTIRSPASGPLDASVVRRVVATADELGG